MSNTKGFHHIDASDFSSLRRGLRGKLMRHSHRVAPTFWQGLKVDHRPEAVTHELLNVNIAVDLKGIENLQHWQFDIKPNLPWADDHFNERVCGAPINPGVEWENWPWGDNASKFLDDKGKFNHNYMERYWPKYAHSYLPSTRNIEEWETLNSERSYLNRGTRGAYGDLNNVVSLLSKDPLTRQAWLPIFFPEDTGDANPGRKPCTLGYQFIMRDGRLNVYYPLRSCDFVKHFNDDVYLTVRLLLWVLDALRVLDPSTWMNVEPGNYSMHATSLHVFANDMIELKKQYGVL